MSSIRQTRKLARSGDIRSNSHGTLMLRRFLRNRAAVAALIFLLVLFLCSLFGDRISPYDFDKINLKERLLAPCGAHIFGCDEQGRDLLTRILRGGRVSLLVSAFAVAISTCCALVIGAVAGYFGGKVDDTIMRITDIFMSIPGMLFAMTVSAALGTGMTNTAIALAITSIAPLVRQIRASILLLRDQEFIEASKAFGAGHANIIIHHIMPNAVAPLIVQISLRLGDTIMAIAGLSFLGLGVQPPTPEWGNMVSVGRDFLTDAPWLVLFPALIIMLTMLSFNLLGDGLRDALDPRMKR